MIRKRNGGDRCYEQYSFYPSANNHTPIGQFDIDIYDGYIYILNLCIYEPYRNKGFGTQMVKELVDRFSCTTKPLELDVHTYNEAAIRVYTKAGFIISEDKSYYKNAHKMTYIRKEKN